MKPAPTLEEISAARRAKEIEADKELHAEFAKIAFGVLMEGVSDDLLCMGFDVESTCDLVAKISSYAAKKIVKELKK